jgi:hypothetical protein
MNKSKKYTNVDMACKNISNTQGNMTIKTTNEDSSNIGAVFVKSEILL